MKRLTWLLCLAVWALVGWPVQVVAQESAPAPVMPTPTISLGIDSSRIADPAAKAVVEKTEQAMAQVKEVSFTVETSYFAQGGKLVITKDVCHRRPLLSFARSVTVDSMGKASVTKPPAYEIYDGATTWFFVEPSTLRRVDMERVMRERPQLFEQMEKSIELFQPFQGMNPADLRILREDPTSWVLSSTHADPQMQAHYPEIRVVIDKATLAVQAWREFGANQQVRRQLIFSGINLAPNLPDTQFTFVPPAGVTAVDETDKILQQLAQTPSP